MASGASDFTTFERNLIFCLLGGGFLLEELNEASDARKLLSWAIICANFSSSFIAGKGRLRTPVAGVLWTSGGNDFFAVEVEKEEKKREEEAEGRAR
ncbi:hypothetical protein PFISCL1PPCAC_19328, partial [Pristionchus fissidentatus]